MRKHLGFFRSPSWNWFGDAGLLVIRLGLGFMFLLHGIPKLAGGPEVWAGMGEEMAYAGLPFREPIWFLLAAIIEVAGGFSMIAGYFMRGACSLLFIVMVVAIVLHVRRDDEYLVLTHAIENAIVFLGLVLAGPGRFSADQKLEELREQRALRGR
ncbi:MAG: DoxX family protein [Bdellovibrionales bacterium]|nr:DoxX family protein [Bdellovibrionales bacterium]